MKALMCVVSLVVALEASAQAPVTSSSAPGHVRPGSAHCITADPFGSPISDWYFVLRTTGGWLSRKPPYCGLTSDPEQPNIVLTCDRKSPPLFSLFTLVSTTGPPPALTGQPLLLVSRTYGLCGTTVPGAGKGSRAHETARGAADGADSRVTGMDMPGVVCQSRFHDDGSVATYSLMGEALQPGQPITLDDKTAYYLLQGTKYCRVGDTPLAKSSLVCDLDSTSGAMRFLLLPAAYPYATFTSLAMPQAACGVKPLIAPPPHPVLCSGSTHPHKGHVQDPLGSVQQQAGSMESGRAQAQLREGHDDVDTDDDKSQYIEPAARSSSISSSSISRSSSRKALAVMRLGTRSRSAGSEHGPAAAGLESPVQEDLTYKLTLLLQRPGTPLAAGAVVGIVTYSPGLVGLPLQQCCPDPSEPHVLDCGLATGDPLPKECWFQLYKVGGRSGDVLQDGDLVLLQSRAYGRYCSVAFDGTLLCVSSYPSNATRNLLTIGLPTAGGAPAGAVLC